MQRRRRVARGSLALSALALSALALPSRAQAPLGERTAIYDPSGHALDAYHRSLAARGRTRVMVWGASHTSEDGFTGYVREALQAQHGDGGPGLVLPARPFPLYAHRTVQVAELGAWSGLRVNGRQRAHDRYGPAGIAIETRARATAYAQPAQPVDRARVFFLEQPGGGRFDVAIDAARPVSVSTRGDRVASRVFAPAGGLRGVRIQTRGDGPVRLFGISLERSGPGVIVDAMGVPGARLRDRLPWDDAAMRRQVRELAPDLLVLAYGTNETGFTGRRLSAYRQDVDEALRRARALAPRASCLVVGPSDWPMRHADGSFAVRERTAQVIAIQRELAARHGCGHFDLVAMMGGPLSMPRWVDAGLAMSDYVHFTDPGHQILAQRLLEALR